MDQKAVMYNAAMHRLKRLFLFQLTLLSNNLELLSYLYGILLRVMVFFVTWWKAENIKEQKKTDRRKTLKNEGKEKRKIRGNSNNKSAHLWF